MTDRAAIVIVPCYNEALRLDPGIFREYLARHPQIGFLFVDDGSSDRSVEILAELCQTDGAEFISLAQNGGKAEAVRNGVLRAVEKYPKATWIGFIDADLAVPLSEIDNMLNWAQEKTEILLACRLKRLGADIVRKPLRHLLGRVFATVSSMHLKLPVYDTQCGAKFFHRDAVAEIFEQKFATKWFFDVELLRRYIRKFGRERAVNSIVEVPLTEWHEKGGSKINYFRCLKDFCILLTSGNR